MMDRTPVLAASDLVCGYPGRTVLSDVNFRMEPGESVVLLGPNGSGKSTLLKTLAKSIPSLGGTVQVGGREIAGLSHVEMARHVAFVPQEEQPPFRFTVRQVVLMGRLPHSTGFLDTAADQAAADEAMRQADCWEFQDRPLSELSGGERQRALIARALAQDAPVLLLDEPTSHLDIGHQVTTLALVRELCAKGHSVLTALHDLNLAAGLGRTAMLLNRGRIALHEEVEAVLRSPTLDETYGVPFRRMSDETGRLRVFVDAAHA